jgi:DNA modification methylase
MADIKILQGNCLDTIKTLNDESIDCCVTSPPYWD